MSLTGWHRFPGPGPSSCHTRLSFYFGSPIVWCWSISDALLMSAKSLFTGCSYNHFILEEAYRVQPAQRGGATEGLEGPLRFCPSTIAHEFSEDYILED